MKTRKAPNIKALLVIDVQNDLRYKETPTAPEGERVVCVLNKYIRLFSKRDLPIFASNHWHFKKKAVFKVFGANWYRYYIQQAKRASFHPALRLPKQAILLYKGIDPRKKSYSAFQAVSFSGSNFYTLLNFLGIKELYIGGLAINYSVKTTVRDALKNGFKVRLLTDAIKDVNQKDFKKTMGRFLSRRVKMVALRYSSSDKEGLNYVA